MENSIPSVLSKISGGKSGKSIYSASEPSQKVLVSKSELSIHNRDEDEIMEVIKRRLSTVSADKFLPPAASTAGATHGRAEDEEMALNESEM